MNHTIGYIHCLFSLAASEGIHVLQIGLLAAIAGLAAIAILAVTLSLVMCVYIRCSHQQQSGSYTILLLQHSNQVPTMLQVMQKCTYMMK